MAIELPKETRDDLVASLQRYAREELDVELGDLRARLLLDYLLVELGPAVYNRAIRDAQAFFQERALDLEGSCYEPELGYWTDERRRRARDQGGHDG
jgi:uncharacterized protein (DUF2164 family)